MTSAPTYNLNASTLSGPPIEEYKTIPTKSGSFSKIVAQRQKLLIEQSQAESSLMKIHDPEALLGDKPASPPGMYEEKRKAAMESNRKAQKKLIIVLITSCIFIVIETLGGYYADSIAIMSDAAHIASDVIGFGISICALSIAHRKANSKYTFGYHRAEILGAFASIFTIWVMTAFLIYEASKRFFHHEEIGGELMLIIACASFFFNLIQIKILHSGEGGHVHLGGGQCSGHDHGDGEGHDHDHDHDHSHDHSHDHNHIHTHEQEQDQDHSHDHGHEEGKNEHVHEHDHEHDQDDDKENGSVKSRSRNSSHNHKHVHDHSHSHDKDEDDKPLKKAKKSNVNIDAAFLHILGDLLNSVGVIIAATIIYFFPEFWWVDPICTYVFAIIVLWTTRMVFWQCVVLILETTPDHLDVEEVQARLQRVKGVAEVHDIHIWSLSNDKFSFTCHIILHPEQDGNQQNILTEIDELLRKKYELNHNCIQIEVPTENSPKLKPWLCGNDMHH